MELKYFAAKELNKQMVSIEHISTRLMIAYPLTKELAPKMLNDHIELMSISRYHYWNQDYMLSDILSSFIYCFWFYPMVLLLWLVYTYKWIM